jgi:hypothetical protein
VRDRGAFLTTMPPDELLRSNQQMFRGGVPWLQPRGGAAPSYVDKNKQLLITGSFPGTITALELAFGRVDAGVVGIGPM